MKKIIRFCLLAGALFLGWLVDAQLSVPEKFNLAFPPRAEVKIALEDIESLALTSEVSPKTFRSRYAEMLTFRAYSCAKNLTLAVLIQ